MPGEALATIVVTPRERYSMARRALASVIEHAPLPHHLVYVSGGDPPHVLGPLREMCRRRGYEPIERPEYLGERKHVALMHDISNLRYCGGELPYGEGRLWRGSAWANRHGRHDCRVYLGWLSTVVEPAIAVVDFLTRNRSELHSADHSIHMEIGADAARRTQMTAVLSPEDFRLAGHWAYFSLNGAPHPHTFPEAGA